MINKSCPKINTFFSGKIPELCKKEEKSNANDCVGFAITNWQDTKLESKKVLTILPSAIKKFPPVIQRKLDSGRIAFYNDLFHNYLSFFTTCLNYVQAIGRSCELSVG